MESSKLKKVVKGLKSGKTYVEIAEEVGVSPSLIKSINYGKTNRTETGASQESPISVREQGRRAVPA